VQAEKGEFPIRNESGWPPRRVVLKFQPRSGDGSIMTSVYRLSIPKHEVLILPHRENVTSSKASPILAHRHPLATGAVMLADFGALDLVMRLVTRPDGVDG